LPGVPAHVDAPRSRIVRPPLDAAC
jgi:hypothetical protein